jgi:hypothetical protein
MPKRSPCSTAGSSTLALGRLGALSGWLLACAGAAGCGAPATDGPQEVETFRSAPVAEGFWEAWGDGQAELNGYRLVQPRYGQERVGEAVLVFVTETFAEEARVKSDGGHPDEFPVMKLNDMRDFQTGIYDYHAMTSSFLGLGGDQVYGQPVKTSFSMQEWCGHQYAQWITRDGAVHESLHSYWDGEADRELRLDIPAGAIFADSLPVLLRGLTGPVVAPGEKKEFPYLERILDLRLNRAVPEWTTATVERSKAAKELSTALGKMTADQYRVEVTGGSWSVFWIEKEAPHRLLRWQTASGEQGELVGSIRSRYWKQSAEGDERLRAQLGLATPTPALDSTTPSSAVPVVVDPL